LFDRKRQKNYTEVVADSIIALSRFCGSSFL
jgi:hypothetical protein